MEVGVILVNADGLITSVSRSVEEWTGKGFDVVRNQPLATLFGEKDRTRISRLTGTGRVPDERVITCRLLREKHGTQLVQLRLSRITNNSTHGSACRSAATAGWSSRAPTAR
jgi:PAS domain-containing protein